MSTITSSGSAKKPVGKKGSGNVEFINMGYLDRILRFALGMIMITVGATALVLQSPIWLKESVTMPIWPSIVMLIGVYPLFTAFVGTCPVYKLFGIKSCGGKNNPCGTLPYELYAASGHDPRPRSEEDHSLSNSEDENLRKL